MGDVNMYHHFLILYTLPPLEHIMIQKACQKFLAERRAIGSDIPTGTYPFSGIKLSRADVEWLLATHEHGRGPIDWSDEGARLEFAHLEGADLRNAHLEQALLGHSIHPAISPLGALIFSITSFHGRGFFPGGIPLDAPITVLAATEAVIGLIIEISFIATFTQRFFGK